MLTIYACNIQFIYNLALNNKHLAVKKHLSNESTVDFGYRKNHTVKPHIA